MKAARTDGEGGQQEMPRNDPCEFGSGIGLRDPCSSRARLCCLNAEAIGATNHGSEATLSWSAAISMTIPQALGKCSARMWILMLAGFAGVGSPPRRAAKTPGRARPPDQGASHRCQARAAFRAAFLHGRPRGPVAAFAKSRGGWLPAPHLNGAVFDAPSVTPMADVSFPAAFGAGLLSFVSAVRACRFAAAVSLFS